MTFCQFDGSHNVFRSEYILVEFMHTVFFSCYYDVFNFYFSNLIFFPTHLFLISYNNALISIGCVTALLNNFRV